MQIIESRENRLFAHEMKFLLPSSLAEPVRAWARARLEPDPNADVTSGDSYRITSIYFDTADFRVFRQQGSYGRAKYRIRRYNCSPTVFLERKLRTRGIVTKRRTLMPISDLARLHEAGRWFHRRIAARAMSPVCLVSYDRIALMTVRSDEPVRLTMDFALCAAPASDLSFRPDAASIPLQQGYSVLELKFRFAMPSLFKELLGEFQLCPQSVSKYRLAVPALGLTDVLPQTEKPDAAYA